MLRTTLLAVFLTLISQPSSAQNDPCIDQVLKQPGIWKQNKNPESTAPADLAIEKRFTNAVHEMVHTHYNPVEIGRAHV